MAEYLNFVEIKDTGKTKVFNVCHKHTNEVLGTISWYANWRRYCYYAKDYTIFDAKCLTEIVKFMEALMDARKQNENEKM